MSTAAPEKLALDHVFRWERTHPHQIYLTQPMGAGKVRDFTWKQAIDEARRMAGHLQSLELPPKSHIALFSKNTAHWIMADLAIWMAGHVSVPLYPTLTSDSVRFVLEHSESKLLFVGKLDVWDEAKAGVPDDLPKIALPLSPTTNFTTWDDIVAKTSPIAGNPMRDAGDIATVVYTSGSTGTPKGAMLTFGAMSIAADGLGRVINACEQDRMLSYLPLSHVFERFVVEMTSLHTGMHLFFAESLDTFVADLQRARPTLFASVPRLWQRFQLGVFAKVPEQKLARLLKIPILGSLVRKKILKGLGLDQVRFAGSGSAPIPAVLIQWYRDLGLDLLEAYGMTENFCYSHISLPGKSRAGYVGNSYPDVEVRISKEGEIQIKSPASMLGYYKEPELSKGAFTADGFLKTGDRGDIDEQGRLRITGRVKELFKTSKGKYVAPAPIENKLQMHPDIEMVCVAGSGFPQPHALVCPSPEARTRCKDGPGRASMEKSLQKHLSSVNATLDHHERVQFITVVPDDWAIENGFLTPTMKIRRAVVEDTYGKQVTSWYDTGKQVVWPEA